MKHSHPSVVAMWSIILVLGLGVFTIFFGSVPSYIGNIVAQAGNVTKLNIDQHKTTTVWTGIYGNALDTGLSNNISVLGGEIVGKNITFSFPVEFLGSGRTVLISNQSTINLDSLIAATPAEIDSYLEMDPALAGSATNTFLNTSLFTIGNRNLTLSSTTTNSPLSPFELGVLKDNVTNNLFFATKTQVSGKSYNNQSANFQLMVPVKEGENPTFFVFIDETSTCLLKINFYHGSNWFSIPCTPSNASVASVLSELGNGSGTGNDNTNYVNLFPTECSGNPSDNYKGNYTSIWAYNASDQTWKSYIPTKPCFRMNEQSLLTLDVASNYEIAINTTTEKINNLGQLASSTTIPLGQGDNWVGYPSLDVRNISELILQLGSGSGTGNDNTNYVNLFPTECSGNPSDNYKGNYTSIWAYNASDQTWKSYIPTKPCFRMNEQTLTTLVPGTGYQIAVNVSSESITITN